MAILSVAVAINLTGGDMTTLQKEPRDLVYPYFHMTGLEYNKLLMAKPGARVKDKKLNPR